METLAKKHCSPCDGTAPALTKGKIAEYMPQVPGWELVEPSTEKESLKIWREFKFPGFKEAIIFVNNVAEFAKAEDHHPNIHILYNRVRLDLATHVVHGLTENDFVMAAKIDTLMAGAGGQEQPLSIR